ncbi:MAG TPA: ABC transporter transmembrane domain-containing protein, partial [Acetobacteraceae bacterium]
MVWREKSILRDIGIGSLVLSILQILPALLVMVVMNRVVTYQSMSTLTLISLILFVAVIYETYLGYIRRQLIQIVGTRLDSKLNIYVFKRILGLPIDYFEQTQTGAIMYQIGQISKIRDFITGKLLQTILDMITLCVLLPVLFWLSVPLTWMVVACGGLIALIIAIYLRPIRGIYKYWQAAEIAKSTVLVETLQGIRTVKSLALEPQQREMWDRRTADAASWRQALGDISNWPQTLVTPLENFMVRGVLLIGAYLAITGDTAVPMGALIGFMMLSGRVAQPLTGLAKMIEEMEEVRGAVGLASFVLNNRPETAAPGAGLRPRFEGAISFSNVTFGYPGARSKALDGLSFDFPAGTMLGLVGRSGSGKSTVTRLIQAINREYEGQIKIDGADLREINLAHLRRSFGVVLQENFLFRGSVRDNIIAGRPGLTLSDAVRAARLAGAE